MKIEIGNSSKLIKAANELKQKVFIDEQDVPYEEIFDGLNDRVVHIVVFEGETPLATARAIKNNDNWRIGLVAVDKTRRGERLGEIVMCAAMEHIVSCGGGEILLTAQKQVQGFYEKLGFEQCDVAEELESGVVLVPMKYQH